MESRPPSSIEQIKALAAASAHSTYWFAPDTMRHFRSRVTDYVWPLADDRGSLFITSERQDEESPRRYSVRKCDLSGEIDTVGEFMGHATMVDARNHAGVHSTRPDTCPYCSI